ncbi:histone deacetylase [Micromonospora phytophila]|uniref:histone deacetylase n=1 Tax=Micromonospora phytophila TaxID=709888 RepID=UPI00202FDAA7|nr:histone deacetylase [Micromonospora phytophila]MCM0673746.1 histone deacetylase [Micromonospora phytophila]
MVEQLSLSTDHHRIRPQDAGTGPGESPGADVLVAPAPQLRVADQDPVREVWYVAYGSNMHAARLGFYLSGGCPPGGRRTYPGCRDPRPPRRTAPASLAGGVYFAGESRAWTGGMAFFDPTLPGAAAARAYLLDVGQFADVAAQEMYREPGGDLDLIDEAVATGRATLGPGRYETLVCPGRLDGIPLLTFTAPGRASDVPWNPPAPVYLAMIASGIREAHGWGAARTAGYLSGLPGVAGHWTPAAVAELVAGLPQPQRKPPAHVGSC